MVGLPNSKSGPFATRPLVDHTKSRLVWISDSHCILIKGSGFEWKKFFIIFLNVNFAPWTKLKPLNCKLWLGWRRRVLHCHRSCCSCCWVSCRGSCLALLKSALAAPSTTALMLGLDVLVALALTLTDPDCWDVGNDFGHTANGLGSTLAKDQTLSGF